MAESTSHSDSNKATEQYIRLVFENERRIYAYILHLVHNWNDADDLMQETATIMWQKFDTYQPNTDFAAWGIQIARNCILNYRRQHARSPLVFSSELMDLLVREADPMVYEIDTRMDALRRCVKKLENRDRDLVRIHYEEGIQVKRMAERSGMSIHQIYRAFVRIHAKLLRCIRRTIAMENAL